MPHTSNLWKTAAMVLLAGLAGCAAPAPYAPRGPGQPTGYTDRQLDANRWRITFTGNSVTPRDRVTAFPDYTPGPWGRGWSFRPRWGYGAFGPDVDIVTTTSYQAYAEIVTLTDDQAAHEPRAVDAHAVIQHLTPPAPAA